MYSGDASEKLQYTSKEWVGKPWSNDVPPPAIEQRRSGKLGRRWTRVSWLHGGRQGFACGGRRARLTARLKCIQPKSKIGTNADGRSVPSSWRTHLPVTCLRSRHSGNSSLENCLFENSFAYHQTYHQRRKSTKSGSSYVYHASLLPLRFQERAEQGGVVG